MTNVEAFEAMKQGKKVRATHWDTGNFIVLLKSGEIVDQRDNREISLFGAYHADEYEIYEEPKKKITLYRAVVWRHSTGAMYLTGTNFYESKKKALSIYIKAWARC